ncbi:MAG TPA: antibiotic biosynthesis monooxygenase [Hyphomicrobium sp.]|nr:antibiotic biosynthesis monooxygenase [Hyphomicrobium sp.]
MITPRHQPQRGAKATMQHVLIIHEVEDYPAWKAVFDQAAAIRKHAGEIRYQLLRYDDAANHIVHFSEWTSLAAARQFFESPELVEIRRKAGVKMPQFIFLHEIERGDL